MGSTAKAVTGVVAAPFTGGASLALTAKELKDKEKKKKEQAARQAARQAEEAAQRQSALELENKGLQKNLDIATRGKRKKGLSSLMGSENNSLG